MNTRPTSTTGTKRDRVQRRSPRRPPRRSARRRTSSRRSDRPRDSCRRRPASAPRRRSRAAPAAGSVPANGMSMPNARVTSHASAAMASQSGNDQRNADRQRARLARHGEAAAERAAPAAPSASRQRAAAARAPRRDDQRADPLRDASPAPTSPPSARPRRRAATPPRPRSGAADAGGSVDASDESPDVDRQQHQHGDQVEHALHDDRRERRRRAEALPGARADTGAARRRRAPAAAPSAANPMTVVRNAVRNRVGPIGAQQVLPADRPHPVRQHHRRQNAADEQVRRARAAPAPTRRRGSRDGGTTRTGQSPEAKPATVRRLHPGEPQYIRLARREQPVLLRTVAGLACIPVRCRASSRTSRCRSLLPSSKRD